MGFVAMVEKSLREGHVESIDGGDVALSPETGVSVPTQLEEKGCSNAALLLIAQYAGAHCSELPRLRSQRTCGKFGNYLLVITASRGSHNHC